MILSSEKVKLSQLQDSQGCGQPEVGLGARCVVLLTSLLWAESLDGGLRVYGKGAIKPLSFKEIALAWGPRDGI